MTIREKVDTAVTTVSLAGAMFATLCAFALGLSRSTLRVFVAVLIVLFASQARAEDHPRDRLSVATFSAGMASITLSAADALITYRAVTDGRAVEANPWLVPHVKAHGIGPVMAGKFGADVGVELGLRYIAHKWPDSRKSVLAARLVSIGIKGFVVAHNVRVLRGSR